MVVGFVGWGAGIDGAGFEILITIELQPVSGAVVA